MHPVSAAFVQILNTAKGTSGCGFFLSSGQICTCAHVCSQALGRPELSLLAEMPSSPISFVRPFISNEVLSARVTSWSPDTADGADAALLAPERPISEAVPKLPMAFAQKSVGAPFEGYGYQPGTPFGLNARGRFGKRNSRGWFELIGESNRGFFVQPGFSGSPVWDVAQQACVGMIKAVATDSTLRVAFLVSNERLSECLNGFSAVCDAQIQPPFNKSRYALFVEAGRQYFFDRNSIASALTDLIPITPDATERHWIYEALGDVGGEVAQTTIKRSLTEEFDPFALRGAENASRNFA